MLKKFNCGNEKTEFCKILVIGVGGSGKSKMCETAINPLIWNFEPGGLISINKPMPYYNINTIAELKEAYELLKKEKFDTLCVDSISAMAQMIFAETKSEDEKLYADARKFYPEYRLRVNNWVKRILSLEKHVYVTAKEVKGVNDLNGRTYAYPRMPCNQLENDIPYEFAQVFQTQVYIDKETNEKTFAVHTAKQDTNDPIKNKGDSLDEWEPQDLTLIFNKLLAK